MISGRFFTFDTDTSTNQLSVFRYNRLQIKASHNLPLREQCPVYLFLDDKHLGFYINSYNDQKYNHELFSFPLLNDPSSDKAIIGTLEDISGKDYYVSHDKKSENASNFIPYTEGSPFYNLWFKTSRNDEKEQDRPKGKLYKDALLLDFLFDFAHNDVFKSSPHWQLLNARIQTNPFLKAILCKGEWLFWRDKYVKNGENGGSEDSQKHISKKRFDADEEWVEIITSDASTKLFIESGEWFKSEAKEMKRLLYEDHYSQQKSKWEKLVKLFYDAPVVGKSNQFIKLLTLIAKFVILIIVANFVNWGASCMFPQRHIDGQKIGYLVIQGFLIGIVYHLYNKWLFTKKPYLPERQTWLIAHFKFQTKDNEMQDVFDTIRLSRNRIYHFFFNRFDFDDGYIWFMRQLNPADSAADAPKICYKWFMRHWNSFGRKLPNYLIFFVVINLILFIKIKINYNVNPSLINIVTLILVLIFRFNSSNYKAFCFNSSNNYKVFIPNCISAFISLQFFICVIFYGDLNFDWKRLSIVLVFVVLVIVIIMPIIFILKMQFNAKKSKYPSIFHPGLTLPKTSLAMLTGWLVWVPFAEEAWKLNANVEPERIMLWLSLMLFLAFICIFFTMKGIQTELVVGNGLTGGAIGVVLAGYAFAFGWGVLTTQFTCRQALDEPEMLMPYVFEKTEDIKEFKLSRDTLLTKATKFNKQNDSLRTIKNWNDSIETLVIRDNFIDSCLIEKNIDGNRLVDHLENVQREITNTLIDKHANVKKGLPAVIRWKIWFTDWNIYIFPRMLLINSGIAFFLGFFAQIAFQSAGYKEPI
jgi:hypothetical protein